MSKVMCYAARWPHSPGYGAIAVDRPEHRKALAKDIAGWIRDGTDRGEKGDEMRRDFCRRCDERKCPKKALKEARA